MNNKTEKFIEKAFSNIERKDLISRSKYYVDNKTEYKYSPQDILEKGKLPDLNNKADYFRCVSEVQRYANKSIDVMPELLDMDDYANKINSFLLSLPDDLLIVFCTGVDLKIRDNIISKNKKLYSKLIEINN